MAKGRSNRRWEKDTLYIEIEMVVSSHKLCIIDSNDQEFKDEFPDYIDVISDMPQEGISECDKKIDKIKEWAGNNGYKWAQPSKLSNEN